MGYQNAYAAYQKTNVNTASQGRLVVLLYEGAVKHLKAALNLFGQDDKLKPGDIEQFGIHLQKTQAIITELQVSLDMEKGGDIARNLMSLYVYFNEELMDATISHNKSKIEFVLTKIDDLAGAWRTIANSTANAPAAKVANTLNIVG
jgi:flagellar protein FliS